MSPQITFVAATARRVLVVKNPGAGDGTRHAAVDGLMRALEKQGLAAELVTDLAHFDTLVARYDGMQQLRAVVAAGGDGTVAEVINRTQSSVPVTVFPLGTANLLATYLGLVPEGPRLAEIIAHGAIMRCDAAQANGRVFLLMAGCGFDAEVVGRLHRQRSGRHIRYWTYFRPILDAIRSYRYPVLRVHCEQAGGTTATTRTLSGRWAFVTNLPCYAAGLQLAPDAVGSDGLLDVSTFDHGSLWHGLRYLSFVALRGHRWLRDFQTMQVTRVRIEADEPVPYQLDGDPGGELPLEISVLPSRLTLLAPLERMQELGLVLAPPSRAGAT